MCSLLECQDRDGGTSGSSPNVHSEDNKELQLKNPLVSLPPLLGGILLSIQGSKEL